MELEKLPTLLEKKILYTISELLLCLIKSKQD
jgi:hypothetical protein